MVAPEIIRKKGYFNSIDYWSFGVIIFEMATSRVSKNIIIILSIPASFSSKDK
jgi:serine/threonine protein kinase